MIEIVSFLFVFVAVKYFCGGTKINITARIAGI